LRNVVKETGEMLTTIGENSRFAAKSVDVVKESALSSATIKLGLSCTGFCAVFAESCTKVSAIY
jgi:hypothetical protein